MALFLVLLSFLLLFGSAFLFLHGQFTRRKLNLPPGTLGLPFVGETLQLISAYKTENPEPFIDERVARYGAIFTTHIFGEPTIFSADPEVNRFILQNEGKLFESSYHSSISNLFGKHSLLLMRDPLHKRLHSLTMSFANSAIIRDNLFVHIDRLIRFNLDSLSDHVFLQDEAKKITFASAVKVSMSFDQGEWTENLRKEFVLVIEGFFSLPVNFSFTTYGQAINAREKVVDALKCVVQERRKEFEEGMSNAKKDVLGGLLVEGEGGFSDEEIIDFLLALLIGAYEPLSTTMTLAVKFLTETPLALAQLKQEHDDIKSRKGDDQGLEWSDYKSMPFTQCVINETLRIANTVSGVFRRATTDVNIKGITIPKGWMVFTSFRAVHLDRNYYQEARTFNPWRWQNNSTTSSSLGNVFTPFGGGPRLCPGYELGRVELSVFLHHFVTKFSWAPAEEDKLVFFPTTRTLKRYPINVLPGKKTPSTDEDPNQGKLKKRKEKKING